MMVNTEVAMHELSLAGFTWEESMVFAHSLVETAKKESFVLDTKHSNIWTNFFNEKYVERFENRFKTFPISLPLVKKEAMKFLQNKDAEKFSIICDNLHVSNTQEAINRKAYYKTLAYSALEAIRRRDVA